VVGKQRNNIARPSVNHSHYCSSQFNIASEREIAVENNNHPSGHKKRKKESKKKRDDYEINAICCWF